LVALELVRQQNIEILILILRHYLLLIPIYPIHNCHAPILGSPYSYLIMSDSSSSEMDEQRHVSLLQIAGMAIAAAAAAVIYAAPLYDKTPYHTSALSGEAWVLELINGHPERICCELGVHKHIFEALIAYLENIGHTHSRYVTLEE
jgi:hypothetical protein